MVFVAITLAGHGDRQAAAAGHQPLAGRARGHVVGARRSSTEDLDRPFSERVLDPLLGRALRIGKRFTGADTAERIRHKLDLAGNPAGWTVDRVIAGKVIGAVVGLIVALRRDRPARHLD